MPKPSTELGQSRPVQSVGVAGIAAGLAGRSPPQDARGATDVVLRNVAATALTVSVTITSSDADEPHVEKRLELGACESVDAVTDSKLPVGGDYTVVVSVEGGPSETFEWRDTKLQLAPLHVHVGADDDVEFLYRAG